ncbi:unnamed protein product, partial [marine sediment metagenome]
SSVILMEMGIHPYITITNKNVGQASRLSIILM